MIIMKANDIVLVKGKDTIAQKKDHNGNILFWVSIILQLSTDG